MENSCFKIINGKEIYVLNFDYDRIEEAEALIAECAKKIRSRPESSVLTLTIVCKGKFDAALVDKLKDLTKGNAPYVRRAAVVGVTGLYKVVITAISIFSKREFKLFDHQEDAVRYLTIEQ